MGTYVKLTRAAVVVAFISSCSSGAPAPSEIIPTPDAVSANIYRTPLIQNINVLGPLPVAKRWGVAEAITDWNNNERIRFIYKGDIECTQELYPCVQIYEFYQKSEVVAQTEHLAGMPYVDIGFNSYYLDFYNSASLRSRACHELGHVLGIPHDYSKPSCTERATDFPQPNARDIELVNSRVWSYDVINS